jgi:hypothetical protein
MRDDHLDGPMHVVGLLAVALVLVAAAAITGRLDLEDELRAEYAAKLAAAEAAAYARGQASAACERSPTR